MSRFISLAAVFVALAGPSIAGLSAPHMPNNLRRAAVAAHGAADSQFSPRADAAGSVLERRVGESCTTARSCPTARNGKAKCRNGKCAIDCKHNRFLNSAETSCDPEVIVVPALKNNGRACSRDARCQTDLVPNSQGECVQGACEITCIKGYQSVRGQCVESLPTAGDACRVDRDCATGVMNAYGICARRACQVFCNDGYTLQNGACVSNPPAPPPNAPSCSVDGDCPTTVENSTPICDNGKCSYACKNTFRANNGQCSPTTDACSADAQCPDGSAKSGMVGVCDLGTGRCTTQCPQGEQPRNGRCVPNATTCGTDACLPVTDGFSSCSAGACTYQCYAGQGYQLYCNAASCSCINTSSDPNNCSEPGNVCPAAYNGLGTRTCSNGTCGLDCGALQEGTTANGSPYCMASQRRR